MLIGPSDRYGDLDIEDLDEFQELEPEIVPLDDEGFDPMARFERNEFRSFDRDFERELEYDDFDDEAPLEDEDEWADEHDFDDKYGDEDDYLDEE